MKLRDVHLIRAATADQVVVWSILSILIGIVSGCAQPVQKKYASQFSQVQLGMTQSQVQTVFPQVYPAGQQIDQNGAHIDVLALDDKQYDLSKDRVIEQQIHFYFSDNKLVQWGKPQDWREREPDVVIEDRR